MNVVVVVVVVVVCLTLIPHLEQVSGSRCEVFGVLGPPIKDSARFKRAIAPHRLQNYTNQHS